MGEQHLRTFQDNEKTIPTILTTSQKLSTGVDARNVRNIVLMRPINSMIEFKQIIGRGTRLFDGKDYFTIYDFVKAYEHFNDPEWDGEPVEPEAGRRRAPRRRRPLIPAAVTSQDEPEGDDRDAATPREKIKIKLADGKERTIQHMMATTLLEPGRQADVGSRVHRTALRRPAGALQGRGRAARLCGAGPTPAGNCWRAWPRRATAPSSWPKSAG